MQLEGLVIPVSFDMGLLLKGVGAITELIEGAVTATFEWADGMDHLGDVTGMTAQQTAAWSFVAQKAGISVDTLANSTVILAKGLFDSEGKLSTTGKALEDFGISLKDASGNVKDQSVLMDDIATKYQSLGTQTERVDFLTNIFGKSGAQLVDVFDTLAQEGGIDAVEQKVKDLGLAIDPDTYEQFNRNLNELKLAATGLGVQLVNGLMPAAERLLEWAMQFEGMSPEQIFQKIWDVLKLLPAEFEAWAKNVNWAQVSQDLINGINSIDWNGIGKWVGDSAKRIANGLVAIFKGIDWKGIFGAIGTAFMEFSTGLVGSNFATFKATWQNNWDMMIQIVTKATSIMETRLTNWLRSIPGKISLFFAQAYANLRSWVDKMIGALSELSSALVIGGATGGVLSGAGGGVPAQASGGWSAGGMTWVGENGPELVNLPAGAYVNHNQQSNRMNQGPVQAYIDYDELARTLARVLGQQMQRA